MEVFFLAIIPFVLIIAFYSNVIRSDKKLIRTELEKKKSKAIIISYNLMGVGQRWGIKTSYNITYQDARGKLHHTRCRVNQLNVTLQWEDEG